MEQLSDDLLIKAYNYAIELELSPDFIEQFEVEMRKRGFEEQIVTWGIFARPLKKVTHCIGCKNGLN